MTTTPTLTYIRPAGRSLDEYKTWLRQLIAQTGVEDDISDERWEESWQTFWSKAGSRPETLSGA